MSCYENTSFIGNWKLKKDHEGKTEYQGNLNIEKAGETYKCVWKIHDGNTEIEYLGIGMLVDNQLLVSRFSTQQVPSGGICLYKPIGDLRSNSALWASTENFNILGSGIALREDTNDKFEGNYKVRYFLKANPVTTPILNLSILKLEDKDLYSVTWALEDNIISHGIGMVNNGQMVLAWGEVNYDYELVILSIEDDDRLSGKCTFLSNNIISEEIYTKSK